MVLLGSCHVTAKKLMRSVTSILALVRSLAAVKVVRHFLGTDGLAQDVE